jgi:hypothetical protein
MNAIGSYNKSKGVLGIAHIVNVVGGILITTTTAD